MSRPTLHWLLWLVIALLPLRGWAMAAMAVSVPAVAMHDTQTTATAEDTALPPCHSTAATDKPAVQHAGCSLCEVCHASLGLPMVNGLHLPDLPHAAPAITPITGVCDGPPGELFRPPRHQA
ncbi:hypothetical protein [Sphaerotilus sp.]|uniref:hypothetical protein n=1 Tax=Sphaerotilus sp. TaxID=2093942 RepID=UPI002ACEC123|nr:hypothetical protein [Sphaerotilus sp.]MDZ7855190.1 hypothetical protein [Sphaerotilus sp.]